MSANFLCAVPYVDQHVLLCASKELEGQSTVMGTAMIVVLK